LWILETQNSRSVLQKLGFTIAERTVARYLRRVVHAAFRWPDSAHRNQKKIMTLDAVEFIRRFLLHVLPRGFVKIRHFGFLANRERKRALPLCSVLLSSTQLAIEGARAASSSPPRSPMNSVA